MYVKERERTAEAIQSAMQDAEKSIAQCGAAVATLLTTIMDSRAKHRVGISMGTKALNATSRMVLALIEAETAALDAHQALNGDAAAAGLATMFGKENPPVQEQFFTSAEVEAPTIA